MKTADGKVHRVEKRRGRGDPPLARLGPSDMSVPLGKQLDADRLLRDWCHVRGQVAIYNAAPSLSKKQRPEPLT